ncbi:MAG TPA: hypothetical protein G4O02_16035 [Caldilineae bacterium]|nr:hypothetical protein [Caldilineae bacterium]
MKLYLRSVSIIILISLLIVGCRGKKEPTPTPIPSPTQAVSEAKEVPPPPATPTPQPAPPMPTPEPTQPPPTPTPVEEEETTADVTASMAALEALGAYRAHLNSEWAEIRPDKTVTGTMSVLEERVVADQAYRMVMQVSSSEEAGGPPLERIVIGKDQWMRFDDEWIYMSSDETMSPLLAEMMSPESFLGGLEGARLVKKGEVINGIKTRHYVIERKDLPATQILPFMAAEEGGEAQQRVDIESFKADIWVAEEGGYLVKLEITEALTRTAEGSEPVRIEGTMTYEVYDVGADIKIEPPPGFSGGEGTSEGMPSMGGMGQAGIAFPGFEGGLPKPEGATVMMAMEDMQILSAPQPLEDVKAFYTQAFSQAGWQADAENSWEMENIVALSFVKEGVRVMVTLTWEPEQKQTQIMIATER